MKALLHIVSALLLVALAAGCRPSEAERALRSAEALMETRPDSALTLLEAIDGSRLSGEPRARHALLLSQAYDKNYIDLTDDSLISIAVNFYDNPSDDYRRMLARLAKSILNGNLTFAIDGFDILGRLSNVVYDVNAQGRTETRYNTLPRYAMLHVIYRLNIQPKKR